MLNPVVLPGSDKVAARARQAQQKQISTLLASAANIKVQSSTESMEEQPRTEHLLDSGSVPTKEQRKEVLRQANLLFQRDRNGQGGQEWRRLRAIGVIDPTLAHYLRLAGCDPAWPAPQPEGRALRKEQHAKEKAKKDLALSAQAAVAKRGDK